jgi:hypothetical protein
MDKTENKIVKRETKRMRIGDILDHPLNPKIHPDYQLQVVDASIEEIGKFDNPKAYYSERNGGKLTLFHGHGRKQINPDDIWEVDIFPDYTDEQADKAIEFGDPSGDLAEKDYELHEQLKKEIVTDNEILRKRMDVEDFQVYEQQEVEHVSEFSEECNFIIKCRNLEELKRIIYS